MPKLKTKSGAKKRFKVTGSGKVKYGPACKRHLLMNKPKSMKRKSRGSMIMHPSDAKKVLDCYLPNARKRVRKRSTRNVAPATAQKAGA